MQVETYECDEIKDETPEMSEEALRLIEELDLDGQRQITAKPDGGAKRMPYREMTAEERFVFVHICPQQTPLAHYAATPIPVRVLQVAAHAKPLFDRIIVWHPRTATEPDPVLVGVNGAEYSSDQKTYILARWGEVLEEMPALRRIALAKWREATVAKLKGIAAEITSAINWSQEATLESVISASNPSFYFSHE